MKTSDATPWWYDILLGAIDSHLLEFVIHRGFGGLRTIPTYRGACRELHGELRQFKLSFVNSSRWEKCGYEYLYRGEQHSLVDSYAEWHSLVRHFEQQSSALSTPNFWTPHCTVARDYARNGSLLCATMNPRATIWSFSPDQCLEEVSSHLLVMLIRFLTSLSRGIVNKTVLCRQNRALKNLTEPKKIQETWEFWRNKQRSRGMARRITWPGDPLVALLVVIRSISGSRTLLPDLLWFGRWDGGDANYTTTAEIVTLHSRAYQKVWNIGKNCDAPTTHAHATFDAVGKVRSRVYKQK